MILIVSYSKFILIFHPLYQIPFILCVCNFLLLVCRAFSANLQQCIIKIFFVSLIIVIKPDEHLTFRVEVLSGRPTVGRICCCLNSLRVLNNLCDMCFSTFITKYVIQSIICNIFAVACKLSRVLFFSSSTPQINFCPNNFLISRTVILFYCY